MYMSRNEYKGLLDNIEISEGMKHDLYENCVRKKRTADFTFRHSQLLSAFIAVSAICALSVGAAAAVMTFRDRLEGMSEKEYNDYAVEVASDDFAAVDEGFSRDLTDGEVVRIIRLERDYYDNGVFPEQSVPHLQTRLELKDGQLAYVAEDNLLYFPEEEMDDEQLLEFIDHDAKKWYMNRQALIAEGEDPNGYAYLAYESTPLVEGSAEACARAAAEGYLKELYGVDIAADGRWIVLVDFFEGDPECGTEDLYQLDIFMKGTGYATSYRLRLRADDFSPIMIYLNGLESELCARSYSAEATEAMQAELRDEAIRYAEEFTGLTEPDEICFEEEEEPAPYAFQSVTLQYGDLSVYLRFRLEDQLLTVFMAR